MSKQKYPQTTSNSTSDTHKVRKLSTRDSYSNAKLHAKEARKRQEAEDRQDEHSDLSTAEKLSKAKSRRGNSKREVAKLEQKLEWEKAQKITAKVASVVVNEKKKYRKLADGELVKTV